MAGRAGPLFLEDSREGHARGPQDRGLGRARHLLGLFLFVAIPLPGTGAWTGSLAATLLDLKFWPSVAAVMLGVVSAGLIMLTLSQLGVMALY